MPNRDYWQERMEALEDANHQKGRAYTANVEKQFRMAQKNIEDKINYWYARMADNNEVTMQGAKRLLRADELEEFKWSVEEYIEKGKSLQYSDKWAKQLENASAKVHINRLEALKMQMQQECEVLFGNMADGLDSTLRDMYTNSYYHTAYEMMKGHGVGWAFNRLDDRRIEKAINTLWTNDGKRYSDRVWANKDKLVNELNTVLTQNIIRGESPQRAIQQLSHRLKVSRSNAGRLIMTESAFIHSQAQKDCFKELDVERFEFVATLDSHTSEVCQAMDGVIIDMTDYKIGLNVPPLHCYCRSCIVPFYEDNVGMRTARGDDGKTYLVPSDMTYKDWKKSFVDGDNKENLIPVTPKVNIITNAKDFSEYDSAELQKWEKLYYENNKVNLTDSEIKALDDYGEGSYEAINAIERFDEDSEAYQKVLKSYGAKELEKAKEATEHLSSAINKFNLDEDIVVHRAVRDASYITGSDNSVEALQNMIGKTYADKGYVSTSLQYQSKFTGMKDDAVHIEITVPKGSNGALIDDYVAKNEYEFLINRNQQFTVVDAGERVVQVQKYDFKTKQYVTIDKKERYMKVQLLPDDKLANSVKNGKMNITKNTVNIAKDTKDFDELSNYLDSTYGIKMDDTVKKLDFTTVRGSIEGVEAVISEYPDVGSLLENAITSNSGVMYCTGKTLSFNPAKFADKQQFLDMCNQQSALKHWIPNSSPRSIGVHEAAHGVEWALIQANPTYMYDFERTIAWNKCSEAKDIVKEAVAEIKKTEYGKGKKKADLIKAISGYANDTDSEAMAEAFADVDANGSNANPLSVIIKKVTMKRYKQYKGGGTP